MVSTPLDWDELTDDLDPREFTIETAPDRFAEVGDIWNAQLKRRTRLRRSCDYLGADLSQRKVELVGFFGPLPSGGPLKVGSLARPPCG